MKKNFYSTLFLLFFFQSAAEEILYPSLVEIAHFTRSAYIGTAIPGATERLFVLRDLLQPDAPTDTFQLTNVFDVGFEHDFNGANLLNADSVLLLGTPKGDTLEVYWTGFRFLHAGKIHGPYCCQWGPPFMIGPMDYYTTWSAYKTEVVETYQRVLEVRTMLQITDIAARNRRLLEWIEQNKADLKLLECDAYGKPVSCKWFISAPKVFKTIIKGPIFEDAWRAQQLALSFNLPNNPYVFKYSQLEPIRNFKHADFIVNTLVSPHSSAADRTCAELFLGGVFGLLFYPNHYSPCDTYYGNRFNGALTCLNEIDVPEEVPIGAFNPPSLDLQTKKQREYLQLLLSKMGTTKEPTLLFSLFEALADPREQCDRRQFWAINELRKKSGFPDTRAEWNKYPLHFFFENYIPLRQPGTYQPDQDTWVSVLNSTCSFTSDTLITLLAQLITTDSPIKTTPMVVFRSKTNPLKTVEYTFHRSSRKKLNRGEIVLFNIPIPKTLEKGPWEVFLQGTNKPISKQKWHTKPLIYYKH